MWFSRACNSALSAIFATQEELLDAVLVLQCGGYFGAEAVLESATSKVIDALAVCVEEVEVISSFGVHELAFLIHVVTKLRERGSI